MKTKAVRLYGEMDLRLDEFELPEMQDDEIMAEVVTDSLCMSSYKAITQAQKHKKVPDDISENPIILGHEFCGTIKKVGKKWKDQYQEGDKFVIQPNIGDIRGYAPGYSFHHMGGDATTIIFSDQVMENGSLLKYNGDSFFEGSLVEPLSCVVGAFNAQYHIHGPKKPKTLVVTGRTQKKIDMAARLYTVEEAKKNGVKLVYVNTRDIVDVNKELRKYSEKGFDDVFIFAPNEEMVTYGVKMLAFDGCLNFFSGPADQEFSSRVNFYNIHYNSTHFVGTSGGNTEDMKQSIELIESKTVNVAKIATHILGLDHAVETTKVLPELEGSKKIVYTHKKFPLTEVDKFDENSDDKYIRELKSIVERNGNLWSAEAERYFIQNAPEI